MKTLVYVGAHHGNTLAGMIRNFEQVIAFEPNPACVEMMKTRLGPLADRVKIVQAACGPERTYTTFHPYCPNDGSGSLGVMTAAARDILQPNQPPNFYSPREEFKVEVVRLDEWLESARVGEIDTLITDAQGMDLSIVRTLDGMLAAGAIRTFTSEVDHDAIPHYEGIPTNARAAWADFMARFPRYRANLSTWPLDQDLQRDITWVRD